ncbi:MAG: dihydroorotate dehydrogenase electron transfer subunit [Ruminococcus sp.]|nr:dihydroorotate dehydrogenase electron transfer subunit [Ruminococcus sp.]
MAYQQILAPILQKETLAKRIFRFVVFGAPLAEVAQPGQFVHILPPMSTLRRPISICEIDKKQGTLTLVFEIKGEGTRALSQLNPGDTMNILGPLGHGFTLLPEAEHVVLVGGGIGNPPMLSLTNFYGKRATAICGFHSANIVMLQSEFQSTGAKTILCTDDGTVGRKGLVIQPLQEILESQKVDMIYACGPHIMLKCTAHAAQVFDVPCEVSLEERMGCGIGACLVCACELEQNGEKRTGHVCKDGPVFRAEEVVW